MKRFVLRKATTASVLPDTYQELSHIVIGQNKWCELPYSNENGFHATATLYVTESLYAGAYVFGSYAGGHANDFYMSGAQHVWKFSGGASTSAARSYTDNTTLLVDCCTLIGHTFCQVNSMRSTASLDNSTRCANFALGATMSATSGTRALTCDFDIQLSSFILYEDHTTATELIHLIPAKNKLTQEIGLYDIINDDFYTSDGTDEFVAGTMINIPVDHRFILYNEAAGRRLPLRYQEVEYLQSNGSQWIDTEVQQTSTMCVDMKLSQVSVSNNYLYGARQSNQAMIYNGLYSNNALEFNWLTINYTASNDVTMTQEIVDNQMHITINDQEFTRTLGTADSNNIFLFGCNNSSVRTYTSLKVYYFILHDGDFRRTFIPCYDKENNNKPGLYELTEGKFYINKGSGTDFSYGADVSPAVPTRFVLYYRPSLLPLGYTQLEWIKSSGTQFIDCGYPFNTGDSVKLKFADVYNNGTLVTASNENKGCGAASGTTSAYSLDLGLRLSDASRFGKYAPYFAGQDFNGNLTKGTLTSIYQEEVTSEFVSGSTTNTNLYYKLYDTATNTQIDQYTFTNRSFTTTGNNMYLGKCNGQSYPFPGAKYFYRYQQYRNNELIVDLIPAKQDSDEAIGMYDLVGRSFKRNVGSNSFEPGPVTE